ncbi:Ig-like domain-containing protein [Polaribacter sargassicola]|uniref:Ig-like domain-containing protein n=1 Tax=Polaribacter sargassicola TaxID=2836891 RepID=UPI001F293B36|nr:Ig-like domain-containing protein [Polaribacter sp. DS7-9]MCG1035712.1 Ig-like domain-containing protein [Polaribacter sp. DS7-9]
MKINLKHIFYYFALAIVLVSCEKDEVNYTPKEYAPAPGLSVSTSNLTDNSFDVDYTSDEDGVLYYAIQLASDAAPDAESIIRRTASSIVNNKADLTSGSTWSYTMDSDIYGAYDYSIYSVMTSVDGIATSVIKTDVTTPDTTNPSFLRDSSTPAFASADISPFTPLTLQFDEPVFYQGGNITFSAYDDGSGTGRTVLVSSNTSTITSSGTTITIDTHGTFQQDDFIIVTWDEGTFTDKSGKSVAALTGFDYYFSTRAYTLAETAYLMQGTWDYSTVFYGGLLESIYVNNASLFLPDTGSVELTLDPTDPEGLTLLGINIFAPLIDYGYPREPEFFKIKLGEEGVLEVLDENQTSGMPITYTSGEPVISEWAPWSFFGSYYPGFYDFEGGTIDHWLQLIVSDDGTAIDDIDYIYTRVGTYAKSNSKTYKSLEKKNELMEEKRKQNNSSNIKNFKINL